MTIADRHFGEGALEMLAGSVEEINRSIPGWVDDIDGDMPALLTLLADLREQRRQLALAEAYAETACARAMPANKFEAPGLFAERRGGRSRKEWDHPRVAWRVASAAAVSKSTGEMLVDPDRLRAVVDAFVAASTPGWRVTVLREMGVEFDDACVVEAGRRTVTVQRTELAAAAS